MTDTDSTSPGLPWALGRDGTHTLVSGTDRRGKPLRTVVCMETGLVRNDPVPGDAELARFYAEDYRKEYKSAEKPRRRQVLRNFRRAAAHIAAFRDVLMARRPAGHPSRLGSTGATPGAAGDRPVRPGDDGDGRVEAAGTPPPRRVLDVGAGSGEFAFLMSELGHSVTGIEPNAGYAAWCREALGLDVRTAHLAPELFAPGTFDLIRLNHVLEHLNDPVGYLAMIAEWLAPGGILYVEVPNIDAYAREKSRGNMFHYGHIWTFDPWSLRTAAALAGLRELQATAARCRDTTGVFLVRGPVLNPAEALNPANGARVLDLVRRHYAGEFRAGKAAKPFAKIAARVEETVTGALLGTPRAIGRRLARRLKDVPE